MPFLIADASAHQGDNPPWGALAAHPDMVGIILKISEGLSYAPTAWLARNWPAVRAVGGTRYGSTWFRGAYHYLRVDQDGAKQADFFCDAVDRAGGWSSGDMLPFVDAEASQNSGATKAQIIACVSAFAKRVRERTGRGTLYYGRGFLRDYGIASRMGCVGIWNAGYTGGTMPLSGLAPSWSRDDVVLWQYTDGQAANPPPPNLPHRIPGFNKADGSPIGLDLNVYVDGARKPMIGRLRQRLLGSVLDSLVVLALLALGAVLVSRYLPIA